MKNDANHTSSADYQTYSLKSRINNLEDRNRILELENAKLLADIEHLTSLSIPLAGREFGKSIHRSVKFRVTRAIWGKERFYQSNEAMMNFSKPLTKQSDVEEALSVIQVNDTENIINLSTEPSSNKIFVYETVRKLSHVPRRAKRAIKRKTSS